MRTTVARRTERRVFEQELLFGEARATVAGVLRSIGLRQRELARRLDVTEGRISQILSGRENLTLRTLADLGWALGLRFDLRAKALPNRSDTPAEQDPPLPTWLERLRDLPRVRYTEASQRIPHATRVVRVPRMLVKHDGEATAA